MAAEIGSKPGWKTSEFWVNIFGTNVPALLATLAGLVPAKWALLIAAASNTAYGVIRMFTKRAVGDSAPTNPVNAKPPTA